MINNTGSDIFQTSAKDSHMGDRAMFSYTSQRKPIGYYEVFGSLIPLYRRPKWFHRKMAKLFFGFVYTEDRPLANRSVLYG